MGVGALVEVADLCVSVVPRGVVGFVEDEQFHGGEVDDAVHGVVADHLWGGHQHGGVVPKRLSFVGARLTGVGDDAFSWKVQSLIRHGHLLVDQPGGGCHQHDLGRTTSEKFCHGHPFDGGFPKSGGHHHQAGKRKNALQ